MSESGFGGGTVLHNCTTGFTSVDCPRALFSQLKAADHQSIVVDAPVSTIILWVISGELRHFQGILIKQYHVSSAAPPLPSLKMNVFVHMNPIRDWIVAGGSASPAFQ